MTGRRASDEASNALPRIGDITPVALGPWVTALRKDPYVKGNVQHIGLVLATHANAADPMRPVWPSVKGLVSETGRAPQTVRRALAELKGLAYITEVDPGSYRNRYPTPLDPQRNVWVLTYSGAKRDIHLYRAGVSGPDAEHPSPPAARDRRTM